MHQQASSTTKLLIIQYYFPALSLGTLLSHSKLFSITQMGSAVKFIFTDYTRLTSLGGETSLSMMLATLGDAIEKVTDLAVF